MRTGAVGAGSYQYRPAPANITQGQPGQPPEADEPPTEGGHDSALDSGLRPGQDVDTAVRHAGHAGALDSAFAPASEQEEEEKYDFSPSSPHQRYVERLARMDAAQASLDLRRTLGIDEPGTPGTTERAGPDASSSSRLPASDGAAREHGPTWSRASAPSGGIRLEAGAVGSDTSPRVALLIAAEGAPNRRAELEAPLLSPPAGETDARASVLVQIAKATVVPQQKLRKGGSKLYWFWSVMAAGYGVAQWLKQGERGAPFFFMGMIGAGATEAIYVCKKRLHQSAGRRDLKARLRQLGGARARYIVDATRIKRPQANAADVRRASSEDALAALESDEISGYLAHQKMSEGPSLTMLARDTPLQLGGVAAKTLTLIGNVWKRFSTVVPSTVGAMVGAGAGLLHGLQGVQERTRAKSAGQALRRFDEVTLSRSVAAAGTPFAVLEALDESVRTSREHTRFKTLLGRADMNELKALAQVTQEVRTAFAQNVSDEIKACDEQSKWALFRLFYGLVASGVSGVAGALVLARAGDSRMKAVTTVSAGVTTFWLSSTAVRMDKADRARKHALSPTATPAERAKIAHWISVPLADLETVMVTVELRGRFFLSVLLLRYLAIPKPLDKGALQTLAEEAADLRRKSAKRVLALVGFPHAGIMGLATIAQEGTRESRISAVEYIDAHIKGKAALEKIISDAAHIERPTLALPHDPQVVGVHHDERAVE
ncbi:hypothetical protein [Pandoraea oxalativorans]|nr:hypothetical protein [Pandoraea oxalativorans]